MSYIFDGTNDRMTGSFTSSYGDPLTLAAHIKLPAGHPGVIDYVLSLGASSSARNDSYALRLNSVVNEYSMVSFDSADLTTGATTAFDIGTTDWAGYVGTVNGEANRDVYIKALANTDNNGGTRTVADTLRFIHVGESLVAANDFTGRIAELAIWNKVLSAAEITSYMNGESASTIAAANLIGYWPLSASSATQSNLGLDSGGDLTVSGATFSTDHPTITIPGASGRRRRTALLGVG